MKLFGWAVNLNTETLTVLQRRVATIGCICTQLKLYNCIRWMSALAHERTGEPQKIHKNLRGALEKNKVWDYNRSRGGRSIWDEIRQTPPLLSDRRARSSLRVSPISYLRFALFIPSMRSPYMLLVSVFIF